MAGASAACAPAVLLLTTLAHRGRMKSRGNMADVIEGLRKEHGLLAAFLEATDNSIVVPSTAGSDGQTK